VPAAARYHPNRDQTNVVAGITRTLDELLPLSRLHRSNEETGATWTTLQELGLFGITQPEALGGSALGITEESLIVMALGRRLIAPSVIATLGTASALEILGPGEISPSSGRVGAGYACGERIVQVYDTQARLLLVRGVDKAQLYDFAHSASLGPSPWLADLRGVNRLGPLRGTLRAEHTLHLRLLDAALLAGVAEATLDSAVTYANGREQFGRPIGSFQALKHLCANMALGARRACDQVSFAAIAMDDRRRDAELQVECAYLTASTAALENAGQNIQIHGGFGFSDEADPHLFVKRAQLYVAIAGSREAATERISRMSSSRRP
jgi:alkylation response protein AidB-like acyl-CoA dehydrogenase